MRSFLSAGICSLSLPARQYPRNSISQYKKKRTLPLEHIFNCSFLHPTTIPCTLNTYIQA